MQTTARKPYESDFFVGCEAPRDHKPAPTVPRAALSPAMTPQEQADADNKAMQRRAIPHCRHAPTATGRNRANAYNKIKAEISAIIGDTETRFMDIVDGTGLKWQSIANRMSSMQVDGLVTKRLERKTTFYTLTAKGKEATQ